MTETEQVVRRRVGYATRETDEFKAEVMLKLDEQEKPEISMVIDSGEPGLAARDVRFLEHMLHQIFRHGRFGGKVTAHGDLPHHTMEDLGMVFGESLRNALGDKWGIERQRSTKWPFDEVDADVAIDLSGRPYFKFKIEEGASVTNPTFMGRLKDFLRSFSTEGKFNLSIKLEAEDSKVPMDSHHAAEAICKALGKMLFQATRVTDSGIPSTKGVI